MSEPIPCDGCGTDLNQFGSSYTIGDDSLCAACANERGWDDADVGAESHEDCHNCGYAGNPPEATECANCEAVLIAGQEYCDECSEPLVSGESGYCGDCRRLWATGERGIFD